ncbi:MAG: HypC/HybG/HupF family hydrogenase formation chaperone [Candidatus Micrarchaeaceae archaeon]|jgi:hydrogenase maturation factor|nr:HypC/HybG/HupF family hydrogenase formation chaperone [Candidatus Micrarchaeota archaeon]HII10075.1 HypC/HybG/HupF family hydrogenase formation chaperone [Candidatus Micrarchaeota archaeon]
MCQAPVGRVIGIGDRKITVKYKGKTRELNSRLGDVKVGDYVLFSLDIAIDKVDEEEAKTITSMMK